MYEIDFLPVGDGERSGDAIALRLTRPDNGQLGVAVIDSGFQDDGEAMVEHVERWYGTRYIDLVVSTHPDGDHIGGLGHVVRNLAVGELWVHRPDLHGHPGNSGSEPAQELTDLAHAQGATVREPFAGLSALGGAVLVASPTVPFYEQMLAEQAVTAKAAPPSFGSRLLAAAVAVRRRALDALPMETLLDDDGGTNPRNNSAAVLDVLVDGGRLLFTSDAGVPALEQAADVLDYTGRSAWPLRFLQAPHHGSRHNVDRWILNRLVGNPGQQRVRTAYVSATKDAPKHPHPKVTNALMRRGCEVFTTEDGIIHHHSPDAPWRAWGPAPPLPPMDESED